MNAPALAFGAWLLCLAAISAPAAASQPQACTDGERPLKLGFYAHFEPVSYSAGKGPGSAGFEDHRGYEADLLSALEAIDGAKLSFSRRGVAAWDGIWLLPAGPRYDIVGGDITILDSRITIRSSQSGEFLPSHNLRDLWDQLAVCRT